MPQGVTGDPAAVSATTANAAKSPRRRPSPPTALPSATRSAQVPMGYAAFSTLAPVIIRAEGTLSCAASAALWTAVVVVVEVAPEIGKRS